MNIEASEIREAVEIIKTAILQGQYEASKDVNRIQLTIYFSIGKYISNHTRKGGWGLTFWNPSVNTCIRNYRDCEDIRQQI